jgi:hypothetical protein
MGLTKIMKMGEVRIYSDGCSRTFPEDIVGVRKFKNTVEEADAIEQWKQNGIDLGMSKKAIDACIAGRQLSKDLYDIDNGRQ